MGLIIISTETSASEYGISYILWCILLSVKSRTPLSHIREVATAVAQHPLVTFCITTSVFIGSADFSPKHYCMHLELAARFSVYHSCAMQLEKEEWEISILIEKSFHSNL